MGLPVGVVIVLVGVEVTIGIFVHQSAYETLGDFDAALIHFKQALKAAEHGSRDAAAARTLLGETRQRAGRSIVRQASFPRWHRPAFMKRQADRLLTTPVEDGGIIE